MSLLAATKSVEEWFSLTEALQLAALHQQPVLVYISAPWCGPCRTMEQNVFPQATALLHRFTKAKLQFDDHDSRIRLGNRYLTPYE